MQIDAMRVRCRRKKERTAGGEKEGLGEDSMSRARRSVYSCEACPVRVASSTWLDKPIPVVIRPLRIHIVWHCMYERNTGLPLKREDIFVPIIPYPNPIQSCIPAQSRSNSASAGQQYCTAGQNL